MLQKLKLNLLAESLTNDNVDFQVQYHGSSVASLSLRASFSKNCLQAKHGESYQEWVNPSTSARTVHHLGFIHFRGIWNHRKSFSQIDTEWLVFNWISELSAFTLRPLWWQKKNKLHKRENFPFPHFTKKLEYAEIHSFAKIIRQNILKYIDICICMKMIITYSRRTSRNLRHTQLLFI